VIASGRHLGPEPIPAADSLYREVILDHHRHPRGAAPLSHPDAHSSGRNPACGDSVLLEVRLDGQRITDVAVLSEGCAISRASGSMLAEQVRGRTREEARRLAEAFRATLRGAAPDPGVDLGDLEALEGVSKFPARIKCALLPWVTLAEALGQEP
jgi:nitrogen fixation NifU-like protein